MSTNEKNEPAFPVVGNEGEESPTGMTLRQYASIKLKVPDSGEDWLDTMILTALRNDFAAKAMQGFCVAFPDWSHKEITNAAYKQADEMLEARK